MDVLVRKEVQEIIDILLVAGLALLAAHWVPHEETLVQLVDIWLLTKGPIVGRQLEVADFASFFAVHESAIFDLLGRGTANAVARIRVDVAGLARVDRVIEIAVKNFCWSLARDLGALAVVGQIISCG